MPVPPPKGGAAQNKPANEATSQLQATTPGPDHGPAAARCPSRQNHVIFAPTSMQCHQSQHNTPSYHTHPLLPCCNLPETYNNSRGFRPTATSGGTTDIRGLLVAVGGTPADKLVAMAGDDIPGVITVAGGGRKAVIRALTRSKLGAWLTTDHPIKERETEDQAKETQTK